MTVRLDWSEVILGAMAGVHRQVENLKAGRQNAYGMPVSESWGAHIEGALAEQALAKGLNKYFRGKGRFGEPDLSEGIECRLRTNPNHSLILHKKDKDGNRFYLVTGREGKYDIAGWCYGYEGKKEEYWADPTGANRPAYFVPSNVLRPLE